MKISTGLRNAMLGTGSLKSTMTGAFIFIYGGTAPADADADIGAATLLCTITTADDGVTPLALAAAAANGVITKEPADTWSGTVDVAGTATFFRMQLSADTGAASTTDPRIQGTVALAGADMNISDTALVLSSVQTIDTFSIAQPAA